MWKVRTLILSFTLALLAGFCYAEPLKQALDLQEAFVSVSKEVGTSVVSISTEHIERYQTVYYPFSRFQDKFFEDFFSDFFVTGPEKEFRRMGLGSGAIIDKEGYILTNEHVVSGADRITVTLSDGREFEGRITGSDVYSDLAVIKIDPQGEALPFAKLGNSNKVQIGQWAIAIGNPFAFAVKNPEPTVTVGVISAVNRSLPRTDKRGREYSDLIQTDASINPGNSGGPLLNIYGEIIGINVAIVTRGGGSEGMGFAVPINTARRIMKDLIEGREVLHGWIGVIIQDVNSDLARYFGFKNKTGVLISRIMRQSPAESAGLESGDVIVSFDDGNIRNTHDLIREVLKKDIGDKATLGIIRKGKLHSILVEIGVRPGEEISESFKEEKKAKSKAKEKEEVVVRRWRGIEVSSITRDIAVQYDIAVEGGVIVIDVEPGSSAAESGIRKGDVICEINRPPVRNVSDYSDVAAKVSGDVLVGTYRGYVVIKEK